MTGEVDFVVFVADAEQLYLDAAGRAGTAPGTGLHVAIHEGVVQAAVVAGVEVDMARRGFHGGGDFVVENSGGVVF